jgi:hypothetical protein
VSRLQTGYFCATSLVACRHAVGLVCNSIKQASFYCFQLENSVTCRGLDVAYKMAFGLDDGFIALYLRTLVETHGRKRVNWNSK